MPRVSVIIPTFNRRELLKRAVSSVAAQTVHDFELIVVDDCSTDRTSGSAVRWRVNAPYRFLRLNRNLGVSAARNCGVALSSGAYLAFLDSDDWWHPRKLEQQLAWFDRHPSFRIMQTREIWIRGGRRVNPPNRLEKVETGVFEASLNRCMITPSSVMMEKSLFEEHGGFDELLPVCEDYDLWLRIAARYPVGLLDERLLTRFGGRADQLSASRPALDRFRVQACLKVLREGNLSDFQRERVRQTLVVKARILANGCQKRGKAEEYERYRRIAQRFACSA